MQITINNIRRKSSYWWRSLSRTKKMVMVTNPDINQVGWKFDVEHISDLQIQKMFINWLNWKVSSQEGS